MFFFDRDEAIAIGGFREDLLVAEDSAFAIGLRAHGKLSQKSFIYFDKVTIRTLERKDTSLATFVPLVWQLLRAFAGRKQTTDDLKYWYNPKR